MSELEPIEVVVTMDTSAFRRALSLPAEQYTVVLGDFERQLRAMRSAMERAPAEADFLRARLEMLSAQPSGQGVEQQPPVSP